MHGFTRRRRWSAAALAAIFALLLSGCTIGYVSIPGGYSGVWLSCPIGTDLGPGKVSVRPNVYSPAPTWLVPSSARELRLVVTRASSTRPMTAWFLSMGGGSAVVWDGTRSTGVARFPLSGDPFSRFAITISREGPIDEPWDFTFVLAAVDSAGNDVGFVGCSKSVDFPG